jgi:acyl carrier protein phosphodiesterase
MNWLAHLALAGPGHADRVGSILPDLAPAVALAALPAHFRPGIERHRLVDALTDAHPVFRRSKRRIAPPYRRFAGILVDVFYDHVLALDWDSHCPVPLPAFASDVYRSFARHRHEVPAGAGERLDRMRDGNLFCAYRDIDGIAEVLDRMSGRFRKPVSLRAAAGILTRHLGDFRADFGEFFPDLVEQIGAAEPLACRHRPGILGACNVSSP